MDPRPHVNFALMQQHVGGTVCCIGKVLEADAVGMELKLEMADGKQVAVQLENSMDQVQEGAFVQMTARVNKNASMTAEHIVSFGEADFDLEAYNKALMTAARHPDLFSASAVDGKAM